MILTFLASVLIKFLFKNFRKRWKTPPRLVAAPCFGNKSSSPKCLPRFVSPSSPSQSANNASNLARMQRTSTPKRSLNFDSSDCLEDANGNHKSISTINEQDSSDQINTSSEKTNDINGNSWNPVRPHAYTNSHFQKYRSKFDDSDIISETLNSTSDSLNGRSFSYYCNETAATYENDEIFNSPSFKERELRITDTEKGLEIIGR
jgi:ankyrin repeat and LEM domain-containing protein 2